MSTTRIVEVHPDFMARTLACYFPNVRYLRKAEVEFAQDHKPFESEAGRCLALSRGEFVAPPAWYIEQTGHFNAIEFNIAYNQLAYVALAQCVESGALPALAASLPKSEFHSRMLGDILILKYSVAFNKPMDPSSFRAQLAIQKLMTRGNQVFLKTRCQVAALTADQGMQAWTSRGDVLLAVVRAESSPLTTTHSDKPLQPSP